MTGLIILLVIAIIILIFCIGCFCQDGYHGPSGVVGGMFVVGLLIFITSLELMICPEPKAIDVYRGRTTLQITYKDSIPTDTVVVFKNNKYEKD